MTQDKIKRIHQWYSWILATVMVALGVLFILSCLNIYASGPRPYSAEAIALRFHRIIIPVIIGVIGIVGGIALNLLLPLEQKRKKGGSSPEELMLRLRQKADVAPVQKEVRLRKILRAVTAFCFVALMIYPLVYFLIPGHFSVSKLNADVIKAVLITLIPAVIGLALCWICQALVNSSFRREAAVYKQALSTGKRSTNTAETEQPLKHCVTLYGIRIVIAVIAVIFVVIGILNGGAEDVLKKAIAICTECIGLG